ncbi:hypothetical protein HZS_799 [Henneguya salminicola]|nr:hypothetical protein HZS_799 [Henneguya salminicola]
MKRLGVWEALIQNRSQAIYKRLSQTSAATIKYGKSRHLNLQRKRIVLKENERNTDFALVQKIKPWRKNLNLKRRANEDYFVLKVNDPFLQQEIEEFTLK